MQPKTNLWRSAITIIIFILIGGIVYVIWPGQPDLLELAISADRYDVRILRDTWGVPHVFGITDADTAYGLAYAHAEDDFLTIQQTLVAANGLLASVYGQDSAANDYMVRLLRIWDVVDAKYESDLEPETRQILEAYADGLNHYAAMHPREILTPEIFPVDGKDIVAGSVHKSPLFFQLDDTLGELFADTRQRSVSPDPTGYIYPGSSAHAGSNTFSVSPKRSADGSTFLAVNSHQPWEGPVTWYEAHVHSQEGWNAVGGIFPVSPVIIHGHNQNLGWAFTVNYPDLADVYVLEINPDDPYQYRFDGQWRDLEVRQSAIQVKIIGSLTIPIQQEFLWSVYGPVVRQDHGTYAIRYAGYGEVGIWEQLYKMNKAQDFSEWQAAMQIKGLPNFNVGYADRDGNIYYLYNAILPVRTEGYNWDDYLPGDTSNTLWTGYLPFADLPQVFNPPSGFVQNANSTPFQTTLDPWNPKPENYSPTARIDTLMTNRAMRARELFTADESISFEDFYGIKYDWTYSKDSEMAYFVDVISSASFGSGDPDLSKAQELVRAWDLQMSPASNAATVMVYLLHTLAEEGQFPGNLGQAEERIPSVEILSAFPKTVQRIKEIYGIIDVPLAQANRLRRGDLDLGLGGGPDVLHAIDAYIDQDGRLRGNEGDSYVMLVRWDANGQLESYSIHQYGSATLDADSIHYHDQAVLFAQRRLKEVWMDESEIRSHLACEYYPGEPGCP